MRNVRIYAFALTGLFVLWLYADRQTSSGQTRSVSADQSSQAKTRPSPVTVVNTPLPVSVDGPLAVQAQQTGSWVVGISGVPTFRVDPGSPLPVQVQVQVNEPATQPFYCWANVEFSEGTGSTSAQFTTAGYVPFVVPTGKRAVVEFVSLYAYMPVGHRLTGPVLGGYPGSHFIQLQAIDATENPSWQYALVSASQPLTMYLNSGSDLTIFMGRTSPQGSLSVPVKVTGHFVDVS